MQKEPFCRLARALSGREVRSQGADQKASVLAVVLRQGLDQLPKGREVRRTRQLPQQRPGVQITP